MKKNRIRAIEDYLGQVGEHLQGSRSVRKMLLSRLGDELYEKNYDGQTTVDDLIREIGKPEDTALVLLESVPREELLNIRKRIIQIVLVTAALVLLGAGVVLVLLSRDRGNLVFNKNIPTKERVYRNSVLTAFESDVSREDIRKAWGRPDLSRPGFNCWSYRDTHLIAAFKDAIVPENKMNLIYFMPTFRSPEYTVVSADHGDITLVRTWEGTKYSVSFRMDDVLLLQEEKLSPGDRIVLEYDGFAHRSSEGNDGTQAETFLRIFGVYKTAESGTAPSGEEKTEILPEAESRDYSELMSTGIVMLVIGLHILVSWLIGKILRLCGYRRSWLSILPFMNFIVLAAALTSRKRRSLKAGNASADGPDSPEVDEDGLLGYIMAVGRGDGGRN